MNPAKMHPLPIETFKELIQSSEAHAVSIYFAMYKKGKEQNEHLSQAILKSCIKEVHNELVQYQLGEDEIKDYLKPLEKLLIQTEIWRNPSKGLAIFMDRKRLRYYALPISFATKVQVASRFYLKPLLPLYYEDGGYYVLELSQDYVKFYQATRFTFNDLSIEDIVPDKLEKSVGFDYRSKMLGFRSGQDKYGGVILHGQGEGKDDLKKELLKFFKAIDEGIIKKAKNSKAPLLLACTDREFALYKSISKYPNIIEKNLTGDPETVFRNESHLHEASWNMVKDYFRKAQSKKIDLFKELYNTNKVGYEISEIIPFAANGMVDTLFVREDIELYGIYNKLNNSVKLDPEKNITNCSLTNLASMETFLHGGDVYFLKADEMPLKERPLNAIYRY